MIQVLNCKDVTERMTPYLQKELDAAQHASVADHLRACGRCREALERLAHVQGLLNGAFGEKLVSENFNETTGRRLKAVTTGPVPHMDLGEEEEEYLAPAPAGFLDSLSARFGAAPWWIVSGSFHALLILLLFLIGMAIMQAKKNETVIVTSLEKQKEPEPPKEPEREIFTQPVPVTLPETETVEKPVVVHEEIEIADHEETDNNMDSQDAFGDEGISDIPLGGSGHSGAIGIGGGGAGAFGRPTGGGRQRLARAMAGGGGKATESAVDKALEWLARHQEADGSWKVTRTEGNQANWDPGVTGLAVLAFLGAGHTEKVGKYKDNVRRGIAWIISQQTADGSIGSQPQWLNHGGCGYHHPICGMALAEASAMGRVPETKAAAQKAVDYTSNVHQCQDGPSDKFGFRYKANDRTGDLSNVGWFIMQLKSAKVAGLQVDPASFEGCIKYLDHVMAEPAQVQKDPNASFDTGKHRYGYNNKQPWHNTTSMGILGRLFMGTPPEEVAGALQWVIDQEPLSWSAQLGKGVSNHPFPMYFMYYTTLSAFQVGGDQWKQWNEGMKKLLLTNQRVGGDEDGSWDPLSPHEKKAGRAYTTALGAMCLEVYYRYLPMYR